MSTSAELHSRFNKRSDQIPPVRVKGFRRVDLARLFAELGFKIGAEIGVAEGIHAQEMCEAIPNLRLWCVDPYKSYLWKPDQTDHEQHYLIAQERLKDHQAVFMRLPSSEAVKNVPDSSLDFVYIDGDHSFDAVMLDLILWSKKVKRGGMVAGHDYYRFRNAGVVNAVDAYTTAHQVGEWFLSDERETDYFWAKT